MARPNEPTSPVCLPSPDGDSPTTPVANNQRVAADALRQERAAIAAMLHVTAAFVSLPWQELPIGHARGAVLLYAAVLERVERIISRTTNKTPVLDAIAIAHELANAILETPRMSAPDSCSADHPHVSPKDRSA
jgi:hypothetical protein